MFRYNKCHLLVLVTTILMIPTAAARSQTCPDPTCVSPSNETCAGAILFMESQLPLNISAVYGCEENTIPFGDMPYRDTYYRYDCTCTGFYRVDMCGSTSDSALRIYIDGCGFIAGSELITGDDECPGGSPPPADPLVTVLFEAGRSYWFELGTWRPCPPFAPTEPNAPINFNVSACSPCGSGDVNGDGAVTGLDIEPFVDKLLLPSSFDSAACAADMSVNLSVGVEDVTLFVQALLGP